MNILNTINVLVPRNDILVMVCTILCAVLAICTLFVIQLTDSDFTLTYLKIMIIPVVLLFGGILYFGSNVESDKKEYEVMLEEDYPASKLYENYEVVGQRGKIWIIRDKEEDDDHNR